MSAPSSSQTLANGRFELKNRIGSGRSGIVFEAFDRERNAPIALKTLTSVAARHRLKRSFRWRADLAHPAFPAVYELFADEHECFFTMELIAGQPLLDFVRGADGRAREPRIRAAFSRLADGLDVLHRNGRVHRSLDPSRIFVCGDGRVVVTGLGEVVTLTGRADQTAIDVRRTPYTAWEVAVENAGTAAADLYGFGALLCHALSSHAPPMAGPVDMLLPELDAAVAADGGLRELADLTRRLLKWNPAERPALAEVKGALTKEVTRPSGDRLDVSGGVTQLERTLVMAAELVGRDREVAQLQKALSRERGGRTSFVLVEGAPGVGKTALVRYVLTRSSSAGTLDLRSRCVERERVPYKIFDGAMDDVAQFLVRAPAAVRARLLPQDAASIALLFPALRRVPEIGDVPAPPLSAGSPVEVRSRAIDAFSRLLRRLAQLHATVLFVDDAQWSDEDGVSLFRRVFCGRDAPPMTIVLVHSGDATDATWDVEAFAREVEQSGGAVERVAVGPLAPADAREAARSMLSASPAGRDAAVLDRIAAESGGKPLHVVELARYVESRPAVQADGLKLSDALRERIDVLSQPAKRVLDVLAVAVAPVAQDVAATAAEVAKREQMATLIELRASGLVRTRSGKGAETLTLSHQRVREAALMGLDANARKARHGQLARALAHSPGGDVEALFFHYRAAGLRERAAEFAIKAATRAARVFAFGRAAEYYRAALDLMGPEDDRAPGVRVSLGDALAGAGHGPEAADVYLGVAATVGEAHRLALQKRAAEELVFSGHVERGAALLGEVLAAHGMRVPRTRLGALAVIAWNRLLVRVRGLSFVARDPSTVPAAERAKVDAALLLSTGLSIVDHVVAAGFASRTVLGALRIGDPWRVCRALVVELCLVGTAGLPSRAWTERLLGAARAAAATSKRPDALALIANAEGMVAAMFGEWARALERLRGGLEQLEATTTLGARAPTAASGDEYAYRWEANNSRYFELAMLAQLGRFRELNERAEHLLRDADDRNDMYFATNLTVGDPFIRWLARDEVAEGRERVVATMARWSRNAFQMQHWWELHALTHFDLYEGQAEEALARMEAGLPLLERSLLARVQYLRLRALSLAGRTLVACALQHSSSKRAALLARASRIEQRIRAEGVPWATGLAHALAAAVAQGRGDGAGAMRALSQASNAFGVSGMRAWDAFARRAEGSLRGGEVGRTIVAAADETLEELGVANVKRMTMAMVPGFKA